jgi:hypothetical protein
VCGARTEACECDARIAVQLAERAGSPG